MVLGEDLVKVVMWYDNEWPTPNVSIVHLVVKVSKKASKEDVNEALKKAACVPMKGSINFEEQPL
eukprot:12926602-Prorocentrum_lima.AAC.1